MTLVRKPGAPGSPLAPFMTSAASALPAPTGSTPSLAPATTPEKPKRGLIDTPSSPLPAMPTLAATAVSAERVGQPFTSFMKVETYDVAISRPGGVETVRVSALRGPGDNCTMVVPMVLDGDGRPRITVKGGSTRAAMELRKPGQYVMPGMVGGRWDKDVGADPAGIAKKIGIAELAEEIGAKAVKGGAFVLGDQLVPTMPTLSTEADLAVGVLAVVKDDAVIAGDGSGMELVGLMKPVTLSVKDALHAARSGEIGEGARFEAYTRRFLDKMGFIPELDAYVHDLPPAIRKAFDQHGTLGLGAALDPRALAGADGHEDDGGIAHAAPAGGVKPVANAAKVSTVQFVSVNAVPIEGAGATMLDAKTDHAVATPDGLQLIGKVHPNQIFHTDHDVAKVVTWFADPLHGPMVKLQATERPVLAAKGELMAKAEGAYPHENRALVRRDVGEVRVELPLGGDLSPAEIMAKAKTIDTSALADAAVGKGAVRLGAPTFASPGQSDFMHHFYARPLGAAPEDRAGFVTLSEALRIVRGGEGEAATEALLLRLADAVGWVPSLGMSTERAQKLAGL